MMIYHEHGHAESRCASAALFLAPPWVQTTGAASLDELRNACAFILVSVLKVLPEDSRAASLLVIPRPFAVVMSASSNGTYLYRKSRYQYASSRAMRICQPVLCLPVHLGAPGCYVEKLDVLRHVGETQTH
ncbi:hypothetical protein FKP32DRAFT_1590838 [Trametes sanguinea]|nr:hypothetical protein FKP32DRAFT_1590838 [Trametes sanguinea]